MTEVIIVLAFLAFIGISQYYYSKEREKLIAAIMAKDLSELKTYETNRKSTKPQPMVPPDVALMDPEDADLFDKAIKETLKKKSEVK